MAKLSSFFERDDNAATEYQPLPAGWYQAKITGAELKKTKAGTGEYIAVRYDILGPTHQGRVVFGNLNIHNPNHLAEEIGRKELSRLMLAIGLKRVGDTDQLIGNDLMIKLSVRESEQYGDSNEIKEYKSMTPTVPAVPSVNDESVDKRNSSDARAQDSNPSPVTRQTQSPPWAS